MSDIDKLFEMFSDDIAGLAFKACKLVKDSSAGAEQRVQLGWKVVTYEYDKAFCAVAPHKNWVNLQFHAGADLPDPSSLLEGTGKSMRHVKIRNSDDLSRDVIALVKSAAKLARSSSG